MSGQPYRIFLATPKDADPEKVEEFRTITLERFRHALQHDDVEVVRAEDDFKENFSRCGGWDSWCKDVGQGVDYMFRTPRFNAIVCMNQQIGKATSVIVRSALEAHRMVAVMLEDKSYHRVHSIDEQDVNDYKGGWLLRIDS
jgi:hypothetical protein